MYILDAICIRAFLEFLAPAYSLAIIANGWNIAIVVIFASLLLAVDQNLYLVLQISA
jgi:hypothetical protein